MVSLARRHAIASTLCWVMGGLLLLLTLVILIPLFTRAPASTLLVGAIMAVFIAGYFTCALALHRNKGWIRWWAVALCAITGLYFLAMPVLLSYVAVPLNVAVLVLVLLPRPAEAA